MKFTPLLLLFNSAASFSPQTYNKIDITNRRDAFQNLATIFTSGVVATTLVSKPEEASATEYGGTPLFKKVQQIETAKYLPGKFLYPVNSNGVPEKHIPNVVVNGNDVEISANHIMTEEHYIQVSTYVHIMIH